MNQLFRKALLKADEVRVQLGLSMFEPINIFDACIKLGLTVRFVDINMEGMYVKQKNSHHSTIFISNQRPLPRRSFTCAHELGHHAFCHGIKVDALTGETTTSSAYDEDEFLVDSFAGALLMPVAGIQAEFAKRNWKIKAASSIQYFTICSAFGTGYETLISHSKSNKLINDTKAKELSKLKPGKILEFLFGSDIPNSHFKIIDGFSELSVIDLEVFNYIILPKNYILEGDHLKEYRQTSLGNGYIAVKPGIIRVADSGSGTCHFIRIQNAGYIGLAENRHLENKID
ncbi:MAG TPA: ImmA/IrrE family metallo-endopeptidase [Chitinophagaceae bacterium]|nr:ImmA/IrrE family metallo-endopeptidase [Chitinophagaceae bacterium]